MKIGCFTVVWQEDRYLGLILEQMLLCPGPKLLLWMDAPIFWLDKEKPAPSGYHSKVDQVIQQADPDHEITHILCQPSGPRGYMAINEIACGVLKREGVETVVRFDSDWIFTLDETRVLYEVLSQPFPLSIIRWNVEARHYWRNWNTVYADTGIGVAFRIEDPDIWKHYEPDQYTKIPITCYHPSYVLSDEECYVKVKSWMHAPEFEERDFYNKEWMNKDDIDQPWVKTWKSDIPLPDDVRDRLTKWNAWLTDKVVTDLSWQGQG